MEVGDEVAREEAGGVHAEEHRAGVAEELLVRAARGERDDRRRVRREEVGELAARGGAVVGVGQGVGGCCLRMAVQT